MLFDKSEIYKNDKFMIVKTKVSALYKKYNVVNYYKNRDPDQSRIDLLKSVLEEEPVVPQIISGWLHDKNLYIYDGIHRITAAKQVSKDLYVMVKIVTVDDENYVIKDFKNINSAICLPFLYLEENNVFKRHICEQTVSHLMNKFPKNISPSRNHFKQNFNRDNMIDFLSELEINFNQQNLDEKIFKLLMECNDVAKNYVNTQNISFPKKCVLTQFYLMYLDESFIKKYIEERL